MREGDRTRPGIIISKNRFPFFFVCLALMGERRGEEREKRREERKRERKERERGKRKERERKRKEKEESRYSALKLRRDNFQLLSFFFLSLI